MTAEFVWFDKTSYIFIPWMLITFWAIYIFIHTLNKVPEGKDPGPYFFKLKLYEKIVLIIGILFMFLIVGGLGYGIYRDG